jgi:S-adenosylmethionine:tRNA ribosyltransferase-isomerase
MTLDDFLYDLPEAQVAQHPPQTRTASRLLTLEGATGEFADRQFTDFPSLLKPGDCLVFNDTRVIPARLFGQKDSGGQVEVMVERLLDSRRAKVQIRASKALKPGRRIEFGEGLALLVLGRDEAGFYEVARVDGGSLAELLEQIGHIPLPPYITRAD